MKLADDENAAVAQVLTDYYRAFSTLDAQAVLSCCHESSQLVSPTGVVPTPTRAAVAAAFQPVMEGSRVTTRTGAGRRRVLIAKDRCRMAIRHGCDP
jgi:ketosteroid isomerase-like protein